MINSDEFTSSAAAIVLFVLLAAAVATDLRKHRIPNLLLLPAFGGALLLHGMNGGIDGLISASGGFMLGLAMLLPMYLVGGLAAGDVKLLGVVGSIIGPWGVFVAGMATMMAGAVFGIAVIIWRRLPSVPESRTARLLSTPDTGLHTATATQSVAHKKRVTHIPYAPAIAVGTIAAIWYLGYLPNQFL